MAPFLIVTLAKVIAASIMSFRVSAFLEWAKSPSGSGLAKVQEELEKIIRLRLTRYAWEFGFR
jgi:hypothetical protein